MDHSLVLGLFLVWFIQNIDGGRRLRLQHDIGVTTIEVGPSKTLRYISQNDVKLFGLSQVCAVEDVTLQAITSPPKIILRNTTQWILLKAPVYLPVGECFLPPFPAVAL